MNYKLYLNVQLAESLHDLCCILRSTGGPKTLPPSDEALARGEVLSECLQHQNLQCLDYYPLTLVLGRTFEQVGRVLKTRGEADLGRLFILIGRAFPYLGVRWQQSSKCRPLRLPAGRSKSATVDEGHSDQSGYLSLEEG